MPEEISFEKAVTRLEKIVEELESGDMKLEDALKKYEEGVKLARVCQTQLAQAETKIEMLSKTLNGDFKKEPFGLDQDESDSPKRSPMKPRKKQETDESGEFLI